MRPDQNSSRSCSEFDICKVVEPQARAIFSTRSNQFVDFDLGAVEFDDQQRLDVEGVARVDEGFRRDDGVLVHLHAAWDDSRADDIGDALPGRFDLREADHQRQRGFRLLQDAHRDFGDDAEQAFRAGDNSHHVIAVGHRRLAARSAGFRR